MLIVLNNKSNLTKEEYVLYLEKIKAIVSKHELVVCPSMPYLSIFNISNIKLGSQDVSEKEGGAYTGETSALQLKSLNISYCLVGHSERRAYFNETPDIIKIKIKNLLKQNIIPILCVGETKEEKQKGKTKELLTSQINYILSTLSEEEKEKIIIAYEPIWSIGTGIIPTIDDIDDVLNSIREILPKNKLLYGGSINEENVASLQESKMINGYLLGGLSLKPEKLKIFTQILENKQN